MRDFPIVEKLGGRDAVLAKLRMHGDKRSSVHAIRMWSQRRGVIPGDAAQRLMAIAEAEGIAYSAADFELAEKAAGPVTAATAAARNNGAMLTIRLPDPETRRALEQRAKRNGRTLEAEIDAILAAAARASRHDLADWASRFRAGLRVGYAGDAAADIRADRQR
jgi:plasmid stability protein